MGDSMDNKDLLEINNYFSKNANKEFYLKFKYLSEENNIDNFTILNISDISTIDFVEEISNEKLRLQGQLQGQFHTFSETSFYVIFNFKNQFKKYKIYNFYTFLKYRNSNPEYYRSFKLTEEHLNLINKSTLENEMKKGREKINKIYNSFLKLLNFSDILLIDCDEE